MTAQWISGPVRSGKTSALIHYCAEHLVAPSQGTKSTSPILPLLVFAANATNRRRLAQLLLTETQGQLPFQSTTPLAFFEDEVLLFWPMLMQSLDLPARFPVRLRPETEQELALEFWGLKIWEQLSELENLRPERWVRRLLDVLQLAAFAGQTVEQVPTRLAQGMMTVQPEPEIWQTLGQMLVDWRAWCLERGLLTYGLITELFGGYLLPTPEYQAQLLRRFRGVVADDVDNYPAIMRRLFEVWLIAETPAVFTHNPLGSIRLGLGADPDWLGATPADVAPITQVTLQPTSSMALRLIPAVLAVFTNPVVAVPTEICCLQTSSRAAMLRLTAEKIVAAIQAGEVQPEEVAIIGPGLDAIAKYTLTDILVSQGISVTSLQDQCPLNSTAIVRSLLTLFALIYPGLGRLVDREQIAEMLVVLTRYNTPANPAQPSIDPVRAGLLADYCFQPHPEQPQLLPVTTFPRWDRLGYATTTAYNRLLDWVNQQRQFALASSSPAYLTLNPVFALDRAIQHFFSTAALTHDQLAILRELIETAQHYWEVDERLRQTQSRSLKSHETVGQFIQLLRRDTVTANPYPMDEHGQTAPAVTLSTTIQYRMARLQHRWHFWLDAGASQWYGGGAVVLWGAPLFLQSWSGEPLTLEDELEQDQAQLERLLQDLLSRVTERVYLCHSELAVSGHEQVGPLLPLVDAVTTRASEQP